jgi:serine/threonine protein kinase
MNTLYNNSTWNKKFTLCDQVRICSANDFSFENRSRIGASKGDYLLLFSNSRIRARLVTNGFAKILMKLDGEPTLLEAIKSEYDKSTDKNEDIELLGIELLRFIEEGILVEFNPSAQRSQSRSIPAGTNINGFFTSEIISRFDDCEIYSVFNNKNEKYILKIDTQNTFELEKSKIDNEIEKLSALSGLSIPAVVATGIYMGRKYLIEDFISGSMLREFSTLFEIERTSASRRAAIAKKILSLYSEVHSRGIMHMDVHSENIILNSSGQPYLIDFGDSIFIQNGGERSGGVERFLEPEYYKCISNDTPYSASPVGEQYSVAVLMHELITGRPYLELSLDATIAAKQIQFDPPISFSGSGVFGLNKVETVLLRALNKNPENRFPNLDAFCDAFDSAQTDDEQSSAIKLSDRTRGASRSTYATESINDYLNMAQPGGTLERYMLEQPICSAHYGAAGIAATLVRISSALKSADALCCADIWIRRAQKWQNQPNAYWTAWNNGATEDGLVASLHFGELGIEYAKILFSRIAGGDDALYKEPQFFKRFSELPLRELSLGGGGWLLFLATLHQVSSSLGLSKNDFIQNFVETEIEKVQNPESNIHVSDLSGMAHGRCGIIYAASIAMKTVLAVDLCKSDWFKNEVQWVIDFIRRNNDHNSYGRRVGSAEQWKGWCNGLAGFIQFWTALFALTNDDRFIEFALEIEPFIRSRDGNGTLCCGNVGIAYSYLSLFRATRDDKFLEMARSISTDVRGLTLHGLFKGYSGYVCLLADLEYPELSRMPFVEDCL